MICRGTERKLESRCGIGTRKREEDGTSTPQRCGDSRFECQVYSKQKFGSCLACVVEGGRGRWEMGDWGGGGKEGERGEGEGYGRTMTVGRLREKKWRGGGCEVCGFLGLWILWWFAYIQRR